MPASQYQATYSRGDHLFKQGDDGDNAFIIESGTVEVYINHGDKKMIIATLEQGDLLGEMAIIDELPRTASAVALDDTVVIVIPRDYVRQKIECSDATVRFFLMIIMERYRDMHARLMHVFEGLNPDESTYQELYSTTTNVVKNLMHQYLDMQDRILTAVNTAVSLEERHAKDDDVTQTKQTLSIESKLHSALENEEFRVFYQPIVDIQTGKINGCEALIRWKHPTRGLVGPFEFIHHAENTGQIIPLGYWIAEQACSFQHNIADQYLDDFFISINLSSKQFEANDLISRLGSIVNQQASEPGLVKFEITESMLMSNPELANEYLNELKGYGVQLAIDDFGTGYSSLSYLHRFPFDTLKIDRAFVSTMLQNKKSNEIVKSLVDLSHNLGMNVVAEGIETPYEENMVRNYQAEYGQGFLYAQPLSAEDFEKLLQ